MPRVIIGAVVLGLMAASAGAQNNANESDIRSIVPSDWKLLPANSNWHGRRFVSPAGDAWLSLYAEPRREAPRVYMARVGSMEGGMITYRRQGESWIVVSGFKGDRIYYRKAMLACDKRQWHHLMVEYPAGDKPSFDRFVTRASYALKAYQRVGCGI